MSPDVRIALQLTVVGMAMVFSALLLFALAIVVLVRLGRRQAAGKAVPHQGQGGIDGVIAAPSVAQAEASDLAAADDDPRQVAAALAVAVALALDSRRAEAPQPFPVPPTALVSTWQAVMRAHQLSRRGNFR